MEQSPVEFLESQYNFNKQLFKSDFKKAKEMEQEQMENTWNNAIDAELKDKWQSFDQFHNETFKSE